MATEAQRVAFINAPAGPSFLLVIFSGFVTRGVSIQINLVKITGKSGKERKFKSSKKTQIENRRAWTEGNYSESEKE